MENTHVRLFDLKNNTLLPLLSKNVFFCSQELNITFANKIGKAQLNFDWQKNGGKMFLLRIKNIFQYCFARQSKPYHILNYTFILGM